MPKGDECTYYRVTTEGGSQMFPPSDYSGFMLALKAKTRAAKLQPDVADKIELYTYRDALAHAREVKKRMPEVNIEVRRIVETVVHVT